MLVVAACRQQMRQIARIEDEPIGLLGLTSAQPALY